VEATIGTLVERAQGFFSRSFVFAGLLPALVLIALNMFCALAVFPATWQWLERVINLTGLQQVLVGLLLFLLIVVLGMFLWGINPGLRRLTEGHYLPRTLAEALKAKRTEELRHIETQRDDIKELIKFRRAIQPERGWVAQLRKARIGVPDSSSAKKVNAGELQEKYAALIIQRENGEEITYSKMRNFFEKLYKALEQQSPNQIGNDLDALQVGFDDLLNYAAWRAELSIPVKQSLMTSFLQRYPRYANTGPTRLSSMAAAHREQMLLRYGIDIELFWPRLLKYACADESFYPILEDTRTQLDFSVAITAVLGITTAMWFFLAILAPSVIPIIVIVLVGPPMTYFAYHSILQNYLTFSETLRSAVDLFRFDLLKTLQVAAPADSTGEKVLWELLTRIARAEQTAMIRYDRPKPPSRGDVNLSG
jgi:hypothetical protein